MRPPRDEGRVPDLMTYRIVASKGQAVLPALLRERAVSKDTGHSGPR
jgi:hypothetical protein